MPLRVMGNTFLGIGVSTRTSGGSTKKIVRAGHLSHPTILAESSTWITYLEFGPLLAKPEVKAFILRIQLRSPLRQNQEKKIPPRSRDLYQSGLVLFSVWPAILRPFNSLRKAKLDAQNMLYSGKGGATDSLCARITSKNPVDGIGERMCDASLIYIKIWVLTNHPQSSRKQILRESRNARSIGRLSGTLRHILRIRRIYPATKIFWTPACDLIEPVAYTPLKLCMEEVAALNVI
ncbi:hypothetical protein B0H13DRAFT_1867737 [Mycena leptocephala]|nr:hypothetical protein B0H13DRAFT_1867737 [Mycena leptocephala]